MSRASIAELFHVPLDLIHTGIRKAHDIRADVLEPATPHPAGVTHELIRAEKEPIRISIQAKGVEVAITIDVVK